MATSHPFLLYIFFTKRPHTPGSYDSFVSEKLSLCGYGTTESAVPISAIFNGVSTSITPCNKVLNIPINPNLSGYLFRITDINNINCEEPPSVWRTVQLYYFFLIGLSGAVCQISRAYSLIALSQANLPAPAIFISDILFHASLSLKRASALA